MITVRQHPNGRAAIVEIHAIDDSWQGHYSFSTDGMSQAQIVAKRDAILAHHRAKSERHAGFNVLNRSVQAASGAFFMHALAITEQGTDVKLILRVTTPDGSVLKLDRVVPSVADLPSDTEIRTIVRDAAVVWLNRETASRGHVANAKAVLGLQ